MTFLFGILVGFSLGFLVQSIRIFHYRKIARADRAHLQEIKKCFSLLLDKEILKNTKANDYYT